MTTPLPTNLLRFPEILCYQANKFGALPLTLIGGAYSGIQATVIHKTTSDPKWAQHIHKIYAVFNLLDLGIIFWTSGKLIHEIEKRYSIKLINHFDWEKPWTKTQIVSFNLKFLGLAALSPFLGLFALSAMKTLLPKRSNEDLIPDGFSAEARRDIQLERDSHTYQQCSQFLQLTRTTLNLALAYFSTSKRLLFLANSLSSAYSLYKTAKLEWLKLTRSFHFPMDYDEPRIKQIDISYHTLLLPSTPSEDPCGICLEDNPQPDHYFCSHHAYHVQCHIQNMIRVSDRFIDLDPNSPNPTIIEWIDKYTQMGNGQKLVLNRSYCIRLSDQALPRDPLCNTQPSHSYFTGQVQDYDHGCLPASIEVTPTQSHPLISSSTMNGIHITYGIALALLTTTQYFSTKWAHTIFNIQKAITVVDTLLLAEQWSCLFKKRFNAMYPTQEDRDQDSWKPFAGTVLSAAAVGGASFLLMRYLNKEIAPQTNLSNALAQVAPSDALKNIQVSWETPRIQKIIQWVLINRIIVSLATPFFLKQPPIHIANAALQAIILRNNSRLKWIRFTRTYVNPLKNVSFKVRNSTNPNIKNAYRLLTPKAEISFQYLLHPSYGKGGFNTSIQLQEALKKMHDYSTDFFEKSFWERYLVIYKSQLGTEIRRKLFYNIKVLQPQFTSSPYGSPPYLTNVTARIFDRVYANKTASSIYYLSQHTG